MSTLELQNCVHLYSMFSFGDGRIEPGIMVAKYNITELATEYYFIHHNDMSEYKQAFENSDMQICNHLSHKINTEEVISVQPVSLKDYKAFMQMAALSDKRLAKNR
jgi:hypothetical protein